MVVKGAPVDKGDDGHSKEGPVSDGGEAAAAMEGL